MSSEPSTRRSRELPTGESCFRELMRTVNLIGVMINTNSEITYCNDYFLNLTGWTFEELVGRRWQDMCMPPAAEDLSGLFADLFRDVVAARYHESDVITRSGERRCIRWNNIVLRDSSGAPVGAAGLGEDITERKLLERELLDATARERRNLQGELHDGLGQELFGIAILARSLATSANRAGLAIEEDLVKLSNIASHAIETCRRVARGFSPLSDIHGGLFHALKELTVMPKDWRGARVEFSGNQASPLRLSAEALEHIYRIAQEALSNALRHAAAHTIKLCLDVQRAALGLTIEDDGVGLPGDADNGAGLGLKIMRYRAELLKAQLRIERGAAGGTRLVLRCEQPA
jgi:PAS domain S-box-containing protein